jgi:hypothetical protein
LAAWRDAEAVIRATARVERADGGGGWAWRGTAFFVAQRTLLTCAHVVSRDEQLRIVWHGGERRREARVKIAFRDPDPAERPEGPFPQPDIAVLEVTDDIGEHPIVWLDTSPLGDDLWAFGYTDEWREGMALGHSTRFPKAGPELVDDEGGRVWRLKGDRVKPGMSGAPVLDLGTGKVLGVMKRTQDPYQGIGAFCTGMAEIGKVLPVIVKDNHDANATPERDEQMALALWGPRVVDAAEPFRSSATARDAAVEQLGLAPEDLHGDANLDAARIGRELFSADLETVIKCVTRLAQIVDIEAARKVFEAVATCTSHEGEPWVATVAAAEIGAQVAVLSQDATTGRLLHLRSRIVDLPGVYVRRGDRARLWSDPLDAMLYSHEEEADGFPLDLERELRMRLARRFSHMSALRRLAEQELDDHASKLWDSQRPKLVANLRRRGVVGMFACERLDRALVDALVARYPMVFLVAMDGDVADDVRDHAAYQALEPGIDDDRAEEALLSYMLTRGDLAQGDG